MWYVFLHVLQNITVSISNEYKICSSLCNKCTISKDNCTECITDYYKIIDTNNCNKPDTLLNYYLDNIDKKLKLCDYFIVKSLSSFCYKIVLSVFQ